MAEIITFADLPASLQTHELVDVMVAGANAKASRVAPCLVEAVAAEVPTDEQSAALDEAVLVLIGAVKRWADAGSGALASQTAGPFGQTLDTRQRTGFNLWPSEIIDLQAICSAGTVGRQAFSVDTAPTYSAHLLWCALNFGADYCSCGVDIAGEPIFEGA
jgi:hypothetical protein